MVLSAGLMTCQKSGSGETNFARLADEYVNAHLAANPGEAVYLGFHEYDGKLIIPTADTIARQLAQLRLFDSTFARLDTTKLSLDEKVDYKLLTASIKSKLYDIVDLKTYEDPMTYSVNLSPYIERNFAPPIERAQSVIAIARQLPAYFAVARQNLGKNPPREYVEVAIEGLRGTTDYLQNDIPKAFASVSDPTVKADLKAALKQGAEATNAFADHLAKAVLPNATGSFAIGTDNYRKMLLYNEWLTADPDSLLQMGMARLAREKAEFAAAANVINPSKTPAEVFKIIQNEHPTADSLLSSTRNHCEAIRQFLIDKQIVTVPSEVRATITKTPEFMVGSTAAMNTPGPFEKPAASEAYYYITLPKKEWTPAQQAEWLTLFNRYVTEVVSIHEAYPGHYVQFLHLNASKVSRVRKIFSSYAFVEGWAHYTEQMMLEEGFGQGGDAVTKAKYKMAQLSESMLRYSRLVCSIREHAVKENGKNWTVEQATKFIMDNCYYERKPAYEEARRGTFDPGYLSYSLGKLQLLALRDEMRRKQGSSFKLKTFHDQLLDHGMPPINLLRELLLRQ